MKSSRPERSGSWAAAKALRRQPVHVLKNSPVDVHLDSCGARFGNTGETLPLFQNGRCHPAGHTESNMQDRAGTTEPRVLSGERRSFASPYIGINSGYFCCFPHGGIAKISNSCRHMPVAATGGPHLRFRLFALLAYFFRHTRSLTNRPSSRGGHFKSHCYESLLAMPRAREHAVCRAPSRARQWNSLVNVKETLCNSEA